MSDRCPLGYLFVYIVSTVLPPFLIGSSSFVQMTRITKKTGMSSNFGLIGPPTAELAALERLKKSS